MRKPKSLAKQLREQQSQTAKTVKAAMEAAMEKIDAQADKITALEKIIVGERAEALYYIEKYIAVSPQPVPFRDLSEDEQTKYCVQALKALGL
jgi:hypothetical protein